jgi:hypothetical protein
MRALLAASLLALLALALAPNGADNAFQARVARVPGPAALHADEADAARSAAPHLTPASPAPIAHEVVDTAQPLAAARAAAAVSRPPRAPAAEAAPPRVRRFVPGSREHAGALAATLEAAEYRDTVAPVARLYLAAFVRVPDYEGFHHYSDVRDAGIGLAEIADEFAGSPEFHQRYGELDDRAFVERLLRNVGADASQVSDWVARLEAGEITRGDLLLALSEAAPFREATQAEVFVAMAYAEALQRAPTPTELGRWVAFLEAGGAHAAMLQGLLASPPGG